MGTVYAGFRLRLIGQLPLVLNPEFAANPMVVRRFHQAANRIEARSTIAIHDFGESEGHLYIVMEQLKAEP